MDAPEEGKKPDLFKNVDVYQQPAAWRDKVSKCIDQGGSRGIGAGPGALGLLADELGEWVACFGSPPPFLTLINPRFLVLKGVPQVDSLFGPSAQYFLVEMAAEPHPSFPIQ